MTMRRRIEVNLEELDQIIERSTRAPLSESEGQKLKTAIHAMAERLWWKPTTEKTSAFLPQDAAPDKSETGESTPAGHGRHNAAAFSGAARVAGTAAAERIRAAREELIRQAAQGSVMHNDDTGMRILHPTREPGDKRTGAPSPVASYRWWAHGPSRCSSPDGSMRARISPRR
jgi:hypothetical protein